MYTNANAYCNSDVYEYADDHTYIHLHVNTDCNSYIDNDGNPNFHTDSDTYRNVNKYTNCNADLTCVLSVHLGITRAVHCNTDINPNDDSNQYTELYIYIYGNKYANFDVDTNHNADINNYAYINADIYYQSDWNVDLNTDYNADTGCVLSACLLRSTGLYCYANAVCDIHSNTVAECFAYRWSAKLHCHTYNSHHPNSDADTSCIMSVELPCACGMYGYTNGY